MHTDLVTIIKADPFLIKVVTTPTYRKKKPNNKKPPTTKNPNRSKQAKEKEKKKGVCSSGLNPHYQWSTLHVFPEHIFQLSLIRKKLLALSKMTWQHEPNCSTQGQLECSLQKCVPDPNIISNKYITVETATTI